MKYMELIKSVALTLLVFLSLALTFTIWTFTPTFEQIEPTPAIDVSIGETKTLEQVVQPYKILYHHSGEVTGTVERDRIDSLLSAMRQWRIHDLMILNDEADPELIRDMLTEEERTVIYYPGAVPFPVFDSMVDIEDNNLPEATFDRIVIDWTLMDNAEVQLYFINTAAGRIHQGTLQDIDFEGFEDNFILPSRSYPTYITEEAIGLLPIYIPAEHMDETSYMYLYEENSIERYAEGLFTGTTVEPATNLLNGEYTDETGALLTRERNSKSLNYVQPKAETSDPGIPSELVFNTFSFVNDHGGWTNDYRYYGMEALNQHVHYQLHLNDLPVFGANNLMTELGVMWGTASGNEQVFRYSRPIYALETVVRTMPVEPAPGRAALAALGRLTEEERMQVVDVMPGYTLTRNPAEPERLMIVEPAWHVKVNGRWLQLSNEALGGGPFGLE